MSTGKVPQEEIIEQREKDKKTFDVNCTANPDVVRKGNELLDRISKRAVPLLFGTTEQKEIMKRYEALEMIFDIAADNLNVAQLKKEGVDINGFSASFANIRAEFSALAKSRKQIRLDYESRLTAAEESADKTQKLLQEKIDSLMAAKEKAEQIAQVCSKEVADAEKDKAAAEKQAETANRLVEEKAGTIEILATHLKAANAKAMDYDEMKARLDEATMKLAQADLEKKNAVMEAQLDLVGQLRDAEKTIAELTKQISELHAHIQGNET